MIIVQRQRKMTSAYGIRIISAFLIGMYLIPHFIICIHTYGIMYIHTYGIIISSLGLQYDNYIKLHE